MTGSMPRTVRPIVRFATEDGFAWGLLVSDPPRFPTDTVEVKRLDGHFPTTADVLGCLEDVGDVLVTNGSLQIAARDLLSPVTANATIVCQGLNYAAHAAEAGHYKRGKNLLFPKASSSLNGPYSDVVRPPSCTMLDYEVEVGLVLRNDVTATSALDDANIGKWIAGFTLCNDVSARDEMFGAPFIQWFRGKSFRTFCPTGPVLYWMAPDDVSASIDDLDISLSMNGEPRQQANTGNWLFRPSESLRALAEFSDIKRGDMILTGTPGGIIAAASPAVLATIRDQLYTDDARLTGLIADFADARFLQPGDVLELEMRLRGQSLGRQVTTIA